jgi:hypothetical protein
MESNLGRCTSGPEGISYGPMRVESGGGIAGHGHEWWIRFPGHEESCLASPVGPLRTKAQLRRALTTTLTRIVKWGLAVAECDRLELESTLDATD